VEIQPSEKTCFAGLVFIVLAIANKFASLTNKK